MTRKLLTRKPITLDTTLRNPRRIPQFISILSEFEDQLLDDATVLNLEAEIIRQKIFEPTKDTLGTYAKSYSGKFNFYAKDQSKNAEERVSKVFSEWQNSQPGGVAREEIVYLLENTITQRKDKGWKGGWESRVHTQFNFLNELGLVKVVKHEKVFISDVGKLMITEYSQGYPLKDEYSTSFEESAFLNVFAKYQVRNPFRSNTINVSLFPLILGVMKELKRLDYDNGLLKKELAFIITWGNNDYKQLANLIHEFRNKYGYNASDEVIYSYAMNLLSLDSYDKVELKPASKEYVSLKGVHFKIEKILYETPDELIRKLRLTMLVTLRGAGRFIDINALQEKKVDHILKTYISPKNVKSIREHFKYLGTIDPQLLFDAEHTETGLTLTAKNSKINDFAESMSWDRLKEELKVCVSKRGYSKDQTLKYVEEPARFEFLIAVAFRKALPNLDIIANYIADDEGFPFTTASGKTTNSSGADIDLYEGTIHALAEPTISNAESFQVDHEIPSIRRHVFNSYDVDNNNKPYINEWFAIFIAGKIRKDVGNTVQSVKDNSNIQIFPWEVIDFIDFSKNVTSITDYKIIRNYAKVRRLGS